jgi:tRNA (cmo5U34)-methyltransferase
MMMEKRDNLTAHQSAEYDKAVRATIPFYDELHAQTLDLVRLVNGVPRLWLDTGCGTGTLVEKALPLFPATRFVVADPSEAMFARARTHLTAAGEGRVTFLPLAGTEDLPAMLEEAPDVVTAVQCHHYMDAGGRRRTTEAVYHMLAPGGLYVTFENIRPLTDAGTRIGLARWRAWQIAQGRTGAVADAHMARFGVEYFPIAVPEHLTLLRETGFKVVEMLWYAQMQAGFYAVK